MRTRTDSVHAMVCASTRDPAGCLALVVVLLAPRALRGQELSPRRNPAVPAVAFRCPSVPKARPPSASERDRAGRFTTLAYEAAITGDQRAARDLFLRAARLDPASEEIAYQLGRTYEALGAANDALKEYCRYTSLAPSGADAGDVGERIARLARAVMHPLADSAIARFRTGVALLDAHRYAEAERAFSSAIASAPQLADAYYDRALAAAAMNRPVAAVHDLERYLDLVPMTADRSLIMRRIAALRRQAVQPSRALASGLVVPGGGQLYTGRPVLGLTVLALTGGTLIYAARASSVMRTTTFTDPFGARYVSTVRATDRPHLALGVAAAGCLTVLAALEAYRYARGGTARSADDRATAGLPASWSEPPRAVPDVWVDRGRIGAGLVVSLPRF